MNNGEKPRKKISIEYEKEEIDVLKCILGSVRLLRTGATAGTPYRYNVYRVKPSDSGFYSCVAGNILGESVSTAHLAISLAPSLRSHLMVTLVMASLCLVLTSHGLSDPSVTRRLVRRTS